MTTWLSEAISAGADGAWLLDETSGTSAADSSGNSRPLTINGSVTLGAATVMPSGVRSFDFPGSGGAYLSASAAAWMADSSFSVEAWIRPDAVSSYRAIISRENNANVNRQWSFYLTGGKLNMFSSADRLGTATLSTGTVYHVVVTYDSASSTLKYYIDGSLDTTLTSVTIDNSHTGSPYDLYVGASQAAAGGANFLFDGRMNAVAYYPTALSGATVSALYAAGNVANITVSGEAFSSATTALDGSALTAISVAGEAFASAATALDGSVVGTTVAGEAFVCGVTALDGGPVLPITVSGERFVVAATMLSGAIVAGTDTSNALDGLDFVFTGSPTVTRAPAAVPADLVAASRYEVALPYPVPTMVDGRPT